MPTGYTSKIYDGSGETFAEFVWHCARAFGAMFHMRDNADGVPTLSQAMEEDSGVKWYAEQLAKAQDNLKSIMDMSPTEMDAQRLAENEKRLAAWSQAVESKKALRQRYQDMLDQVQAWTPPTSDHDNLRSFMIEQLNESIRFDCYDPEQPKEVNLDEYRAAAIEHATWSINYHAEQLSKAKHNEAKRRAWIEALHASVPNPRG